jgi:hypothetical protein
MATDIFSRNVTYGGAFSADGAAVTFAGFNAGLLVQQIQWAYQQAITRLYEVGSASVYLVAGRTQGTVKFNRVLGPVAILPDFYIQYGNVCNAAGNNITFAATTGCGDSGGGGTQTIGMYHVIITSIQGGVSAQDMIITEALDMMFLYMTLE